MAIITVSAKEVAKKYKNHDRSVIDAMTDADIARQIASNPDAAPDMSEALRAGKFQRRIAPERVKAVRRKTGLSQPAFAKRLRLNVATIRNWEQGRTYPDAAAITLLTLIDRDPQWTMKALA